ncbi:BlaI/MecI/CopY family transcriptional regulator [Microbacterium sp. CFBP 8794]|uniref:BlaI/MecI/CopY family transcriptional regulator n=1 Tax=Microbacterium sp. CFBP 8794 TaxID=2775269 RepID=UPI0017872CFB|nr:BlaI/MecI/CopY family transcriptional regulator [Microbacterium sp. CFBP 8794]MBD8478045.1 BlaI/MecI/CopY family transcriptional regulator [Microbacterium sp. CFBP 8794]
MSGTRNRGRGELEAEVLAILRTHAEPAGAADIQSAFTEPTPAYTTILTALDRMIEKGEVTRHAESPRKVRFAARLSAAENASDSMHRALKSTDDRRAALLQFAGDLDADDVDMLRSALGKKRRAT